MTCEIIIAGFGGQGVLFLGKLIAYAGLFSGYEVSWMPSYGAEMRGGTANCAVIVSDEPIGSPCVYNPDFLIAMNDTSFKKFEPCVKENGTIIANASLIESKPERDDLQVSYIPATELAIANEIDKSANIIIAGYLFKTIRIFTDSAIQKAIEKCSPSSKPELLEMGLKALEIGRTID